MNLRDRPSRWVLLGLCLLSIGMISLPQKYLSTLRRVAQWGLSPLVSSGNRLVVHLRTRVDEITGTTIPSKNEQLQALEQQILTMRQLINYQRRQIKTLTKWSRVLKGFNYCRLIPGRVISLGTLPFHNRRLISSTSRRVHKGDFVTTRMVVLESNYPLRDEIFVLGRNYLVGRIVQSEGYLATLQLVTDSHFRTPALVWRMIKPGQSRTIYIVPPDGGLSKRTYHHSGKTPAAEPIGQPCKVEAKGDGKQIVLKHVPASHGIQPGDVLTSDSTGGLLPIGLTIGKVVEVRQEKKDAHFVTIFVKPLADLSRLQDVYIVVPPERVKE